MTVVFGYLTNNNVIYDINGTSKGKFKLQDTGKIIESASGIMVYGVIPTLATSFDCKYLGQGAGELIKTDKKLIFIREIKPGSKGSFGFPPLLWLEWAEERRLKKIGVREFFETDIEDIVGYYQHSSFLSKAVVLYIRSINSFGGVENKTHCYISLHHMYEIINDRHILKKKLTKSEIKEMRKEEKEYRRKHKAMHQ